MTVLYKILYLLRCPVVEVDHLYNRNLSEAMASITAFALRTRSSDPVAAHVEAIAVIAVRTFPIILLPLGTEAHEAEHVDRVWNAGSLIPL